MSSLSVAGIGGPPSVATGLGTSGPRNSFFTTEPGSPILPGTLPQHLPVSGPSLSYIMPHLRHFIFAFISRGFVSE